MDSGQGQWPLFTVSKEYIYYTFTTWFDNLTRIYILESYYIIIKYLYYAVICYYTYDTLTCFLFM